MENKLYRSQRDQILGGVCAGLSKYLNIDVVLVRLFFVVFTLAGGIGPLVYIILWIVVPSDESVTGGRPGSTTIDGEVIRERAETFRDEVSKAVNQPSKKAGLYIGVGLILVGGYIFLKNLNIPWLAWVNSNVILAGLIILAGVGLLFAAFRKDK
ncbi:MAG: PspC domain-containing protein [Anaerolineaceae bacterium]|jgi:phage shock protein PspC (stress-responsive transcriptional regulator)